VMGLSALRVEANSHSLMSGRREAISLFRYLEPTSGRAVLHPTPPTQTGVLLFIASAGNAAEMLALDRGGSG
jgi:hypothetical protein